MLDTFEGSHRIGRVRKEQETGWVAVAKELASGYDLSPDCLPTRAVQQQCVSQSCDHKVASHLYPAVYEPLPG
jgi:hypothetical protein